MARVVAVAAALLAAALLAAPAHAASSVVSNSQPRVDSATGQILDIHDGVTIRGEDGVFYWYGASYGMCKEMATGCASIEVGACGFNLNHSVSLATSKDLITWDLVGVVLAVEDRPAGILFGPTVARSAATGLWVLWVNILPVVGGSGDFDASYYAGFTSASPTGPFKFATNITGLIYDRLPDSPYLFVDDDGAGYVALTHEDTHVNNVQALTPDLLHPLVPHGGASPQIGPGNNEGVLMFKRQGLYYVGYGACCCFCGEGSNVDFYVSTTPLGAYNYSGTAIVPQAWHAQTGAVWFTGVDWVLFGDRWQSAPDGIKAHDFSYMTPLTFNASGAPATTITSFQDNVTINF